MSSIAESPKPTFVIDAPFQINDKPLKVEGYSNAEMLRIGDMSKKKTIITLVALCAISILAAVIFSYVPGLSGITSFLCAAVIFGVLIAVAIPAVKHHMLKKDAHVLLRDKQNDIKDLFNQQESGWSFGFSTDLSRSTLRKNDLLQQGDGIADQVETEEKEGTYYLRLYEEKGTLLLRGKQIIKAIRDHLGE